MYVVPTPDSPADVYLLTINTALAVETPLRAVHEAALLLPVKPLAGQLVVTVPPLRPGLGNIAQAVPVLRDKPGQLSSGAVGPGSGTGAQLNISHL